jgi:protein-tyrosine phosphatase
MAEALLREHLKCHNGQPRISVWSAGLAPAVKERADDRARAAAREFGVSLDPHRPRRLTREQVERADAIFIMDRFNQARMLVSYPEAARKTFFIGAYADSARRSAGIEIADPYDGTPGDVRQCYRELEACVRELAIALGAGEQGAGDQALACAGKNMTNRVGAANGG